ncbi:hypothetical protein J6590_035446 [Homalodisca vitripennis]|nr:hypothetical protein J6590_035446 [Homalodisca vitripennis]
MKSESGNDQICDQRSHEGKSENGNDQTCHPGSLVVGGGRGGRISRSNQARRLGNAVYLSSSLIATTIRAKCPPPCPFRRHISGHSVVSSPCKQSLNSWRLLEVFTFVYDCERVIIAQM